MEANSPGLERPRAVQMAAAVLILVPFLDMLTMHRTGTPVFGWVSWMLIAAAGVSLMIRHKSSWVFGLVLCGIFVTITGTSLVRDMAQTDPVLNTAKLLDCLLVLFIVGTVSYFFRYPYLDRRQNWFSPTGERFAINCAVVLAGQEAQTVDMSYTGARIAVNDAKAFKVDDVVALQLTDINDIQCRARIIDVSEGQVRIHFEGVNTADKDLIREWLTSQNLQKV